MDSLSVDAWAMSCRALSRRIEHHCLSFLFDAFAVDALTFSYVFTGRNTPLRETLRTLMGSEPAAGVRITRVDFEQRAPALVHRVISP